MEATLTAHPYRDLDVVDERAPRFNQAVVALGSIATLITGWWPIVGLLALQLIVGLTLGRRFCLPCVFYFEVVQPRVGEGEIEDARPPRFANILGAIFLGTATLAFGAGLSGIGQGLTAIVAALATLAALTGLCVGCEMYKVLAHFRGIRPGHLDSIDLLELGAHPTNDLVVHFTHPLCGGCGEIEDRLTAEGRSLTRVDVSRQPELARKYHVTVVPTTVAVDSQGRVLERIA